MSEVKRLNDLFRQNTKQIFVDDAYQSLDEQTRLHIKEQMLIQESDGDGSVGEFVYGTVNVIWMVVCRDINDPKKPAADPLNIEQTERILCLGIKKN